MLPLLSVLCACQSEVPQEDIVPNVSLRLEPLFLTLTLHVHR